MFSVVYGKETLYEMSFLQLRDYFYLNLTFYYKYRYK